MAGATSSPAPLKGPGSGAGCAGRDEGGGMDFTIGRNLESGGARRPKVNQHTNCPMPMPSGFR